MLFCQHYALSGRSSIHFVLLRGTKCYPFTRSAAMDRRKYYREKYGDISEDILDELIRFDRHEEYLKRKDALGHAILYGDETELYRSAIIKYFSCEDDNHKPDISCSYLSDALDMLEKSNHADHDLIMNKYFSDDPLKVKDIAAEKGVKKQAIYKRIKNAHFKLKRIIIAHKNYNRFL